MASTGEARARAHLSAARPPNTRTMPMPKKISICGRPGRSATTRTESSWFGMYSIDNGDPCSALSQTCTGTLSARTEGASPGSVKR